MSAFRPSHDRVRIQLSLGFLMTTMSGVINHPAINGEMSGTTHGEPIDLVGGPFSVIESDPGNILATNLPVGARQDAITISLF